MNTLEEANKIQDLVSKSENVDLKNATRLPGNAFVLVNPEITKYFEFYAQKQGKLQIEKTTESIREQFDPQISKYEWF